MTPSECSPFPPPSEVKSELWAIFTFDGIEGLRSYIEAQEEKIELAALLKSTAEQIQCQALTQPSAEDMTDYCEPTITASLANEWANTFHTNTRYFTVCVSIANALFREFSDFRP